VPLSRVVKREGRFRLAGIFGSKPPKDPKHSNRAQRQDRYEENVPLLPKESTRLMKAFSLIENPAMRNAIIELVEKLSANQN
jgi:hypothetical protein